MQSIYSVHVVADLEAARAFYVEHFGLSVIFEADWYVQLHGATPAVQLAFIRPGHETVPAAFRDTLARGVLVSIEVGDATALARRFAARGVPLVYPLTDEPFGQRHFMVVDPSGLLVDVIEPIEPDPEWYRVHAKR
jgi:catechol 2,3-dioxygenase-like lactoylglutathione lyase family enzyme